MNRNFLRSTTRASGWAVTAIAAIALIGGGAKQAQAQHYNNGLAAKPAMGWSSWSAIRSARPTPSSGPKPMSCMPSFNPRLSSTLMSMTAGISTHRFRCDQYGRLIPDPVKFPNGIKPVADYVHSLGLKFGIYEKPDIPQAAVNQNTPIFGTSYHAQDIVTQPLGPRGPRRRLTSVLTRSTGARRARRRISKLRHPTRLLGRRLCQARLGQRDH